MAATNLLEAVAAALDADATLASLAPGGAWVNSAPAKSNVSHVVISKPTSQRLNESGTGSIENISIDVMMFGTSKGNARAIRRRADDVLNDAALTFTDGTLLHIRTANRNASMDPTRGPAGTDVWLEVLHIQAVVGRG